MVCLAEAALPAAPRGEEGPGCPEEAGCEGRGGPAAEACPSHSMGRTSVGVGGRGSWASTSWSMGAGPRPGRCGCCCTCWREGLVGVPSISMGTPKGGPEGVAGGAIGAAPGGKPRPNGPTKRAGWGLACQVGLDQTPPPTAAAAAPAKPLLSWAGSWVPSLRAWEAGEGPGGGGGGAGGPLSGPRPAAALWASHTSAGTGRCKLPGLRPSTMSTTLTVGESGNRNESGSLHSRGSPAGGRTKATMQSVRPMPGTTALPAL